MQCAQRVAVIAISLLQKGQTFVVGSTEASSCFFLPIVISVFIPFIRRNKTNAMIIKLMIAVIF